MYTFYSQSWSTHTPRGTLGDVGGVPGKKQINYIFKFKQSNSSFKLTAK